MYSLNSSNSDNIYLRIRIFVKNNNLKHTNSHDPTNFPVIMYDTDLALYVGAAAQEAQSIARDES